MWLWSRNCITGQSVWWSQFLPSEIKTLLWDVLTHLQWLPPLCTWTPGDLASQICPHGASSTDSAGLALVCSPQRRFPCGSHPGKPWPLHSPGCLPRLGGSRLPWVLVPPGDRGRVVYFLHLFTCGWDRVATPKLLPWDTGNQKWSVVLS